MKTKKNNTKKKLNSKKQEKNNNKNAILVGLILVILICVFFSIKTIIKNNKDDEPKINDSDAIHKEILNDTKIGDLSITDAKLTVNEGVTTYMATATNETDHDYYINVLYITYTNGHATHKMPVLTDITIAPHGKEPIFSILDSDISDTTKITFEIK